MEQLTTMHQIRGTLIINSVALVAQKPRREDELVELICFSVISGYCSYVILLVSQVVD